MQLVHDRSPTATRAVRSSNIAYCAEGMCVESRRVFEHCCSAECGRPWGSGAAGVRTDGAPGRAAAPPPPPIQPPRHAAARCPDLVSSALCLHEVLAPSASRTTHATHASSPRATRLAPRHISAPPHHRAQLISLINTLINTYNNISKLTIINIYYTRVTILSSSHIGTTFV